MPLKLVKKIAFWDRLLQILTPHQHSAISPKFQAAVILLEALGSHRWEHHHHPKLACQLSPSHQFLSHSYLDLRMEQMLSQDLFPNHNLLVHQLLRYKELVLIRYLSRLVFHQLPFQLLLKAHHSKATIHIVILL